MLWPSIYLNTKSLLAHTENVTHMFPESTASNSVSLPADVKLLKQIPRIVTSSTTANWNSGVAPSGEAGATLVTMGRAGAWCRVNFGGVILTGFNIAATVTIRGMTQSSDITSRVAPAISIYSREMAILSWWIDLELFGLYRVELYSDQAADDGVAVPYEYRIKDW